ncbi:lipopolysaccharide kinase InaA family protein [Larsenimonas suaedae]|uniref:Lipopolysaccharide kinase InaA family protein n=1 Tax=Larsenimonas suaedae TaxID=1851019 RepID=A0ABU1GY15_9GAMM|nr:lipopolysaccharide kinase InaA family protein [Larsenimonas suaedae]MCM2972834.1 lipopolysaccharide kinase InaA family protein [Larsenimonas suaedae]MDR5896933.1 lipopolysaccharide kinase InaA family protein [Larsenimonas suaedae]
MNDYHSPAYADLFQRHQLDDFEALWALSLTPVDAPNLERGGHSEVCLLTLENQRFFVKRQTNHLGRSVQRPFGEPTFAREFRNIQLFQKRGIPALDAAWFGERRSGKSWRAILITPALDGHEDLVDLNARWQTLSEETQYGIIDASAALLRTLHDSGLLHGSLYAKHVFLAQTPSGWIARFIDLEKSRPFFRRSAERVRDLDVFARRLDQWQENEWQRFFKHYAGPEGPQWRQKLDARLARKRKK